MCDCKSETLRILNLCQHFANGSPPTVSSSPPLLTSTSSAPAQGTDVNNIDATLTIARELVQHWGTINGCSNAESHMTSQTLRSMTDAIGLVLPNYEIAIESIAQKSQSSSHTTAPEHNTTPSVFIGTLELDPSEAAIVVRESLKQSIVRLAAMLQDIEEEAALLSLNQAEYPLPDKDVKGLITRLFRMLANVNRLVDM
ncbi:hypothetical protein HD806DRAFT_502392 [Xylariaceae sp. AK1471]|nr:hypothetical protein HD806DRAFT_502392 [Xylariaceae sp. AK1471]